MSNYIPFPFFHDDVPVDISFVFETEKPAGKHGFLQTRGREFVFEDGTPVRFWGTNFNGCGCFPEKAYAEKLARRLAKLGINLVRLHQLDSEWHTPNIFAFTKGRRTKDASFDPESMDRMDYLIYCLKKEGIYTYMDMFTYRRFKTEEGVENASLLPDAAKPYCIFSDKLIALQKDLCTRLWTHYNPYTGLTYADEPAIVLAEIVNESDLFKQSQKITLEPYRKEFLQKLDLWLREKGIQKCASDFDPEDYEDATLKSFKIDLQEAYYITMMEHMRKCGIKIPITGTNWVTSPENQKTQLKTDFYDTHPYYYDWRWGEFEKYCMNQGITQKKQSFLSGSLFATDKNKPTYVSEWDMPWPNEFRAESPVYCAAVGMFQGWSGFAIHTYSYSCNLERMQMLGKEISAEKIGGTPYRQGIFSAWNDPAKFGLFYHAALITRRGDVSPAKGTVSFPAAATNGDFDHAPVAENFEKTGVVYDNSNLTPVSPTPSTDSCDVLSDTGELYRNWEKNYGTIDTPKTKCAYGFLGKNDALNLSGVKIDCKTDFATIAISSLTDDAITSSDNMLITAVGRAKNTDSVFDGDKMVDIGKPPVCIEVIEAELEIETDVDGLRVWAVSAEGFYIGTVPTTYENGKLKITLGESSNSMYYLIVRE